LWLFVLAPLLGAVLAAGIVTVLVDGDLSPRVVKEGQPAGGRPNGGG
jgi:hypothetical protein